MNHEAVYRTAPATPGLLMNGCIFLLCCKILIALIFIPVALQNTGFFSCCVALAGADAIAGANVMPSNLEMGDVRNISPLEFTPKQEKQWASYTYSLFFLLFLQVVSWSLGKSFFLYFGACCRSVLPQPILKTRYGNVYSGAKFSFKICPIEVIC